MIIDKVKCLGCGQIWERDQCQQLALSGMASRLICPVCWTDVAPIDPPAAPAQPESTLLQRIIDDAKARLP